MPVTMTTKSSAAQFRVGSLGAGWQLLGGREYCFMGKFVLQKVNPWGGGGGSPGQRNWSIDWGEEGWGWGKSQDSPRRAWAMAVHWFKQTACVHGTPG